MLVNSSYSTDSTLEGEENKKAILRLYVALESKDGETVRKILAPDIEWSFHGPPRYRYLARLLTGEPDCELECVKFKPYAITALGNKLVVESRGDETPYWIHVWTVEKGIVTQVREYFDTTLTVTDFQVCEKNFPSPIWESSVVKRKGKSMPGLLLSI